MKRQTSFLMVVSASLLVLTSGIGCAELPEEEFGESAQALVSACPPQEKVWGIDIARYQHPGGAPIDWTQVAFEKQFVIVKATEGTSYVNPYFANDSTQAKQAGLGVGAYHYLRFSSDGRAQADHFISTVGPQISEDALPPLVDVEDTSDSASASQRVETLRAWLERVEAVTGRKPMIYSGAWYWAGEYLQSPQGFAQYPLMWAAYPSDPDAVHLGTHCPRIPEEFSKLSIWQYQGTGGRTPGITGDVDQDVFYGTWEELRTLGQADRPDGSTTESAQVASGGQGSAPRAAQGGALATVQVETTDSEGNSVGPAQETDTPTGCAASPAPMGGWQGWAGLGLLVGAGAWRKARSGRARERDSLLGAARPNLVEP